MNSEYMTLLGSDNKTQVTLRVIRTDAAINSGNSGGGLFDAQGKLVGITNAKRIDQISEDVMGNVEVEESVDNIGYALPITQVGYAVNNILDNSGTVKKATLGITVETTDSKAKINADGKAVIEEEVTVASVDSGSAAEGILQEGDILRTISLGENSVDITRRYQVIDFMLTVRQGDSVVLTVERDGKQKVLSVTFDNTSYFQTVA